MWSLRPLLSLLPCVASSGRSSTLRCLSPHSRRLLLWQVTYCGYAHWVHFGTNCVPPSVRRDSTTRGGSASTRWSHRRSWRTSGGASLRRDVRLRAPLRRVIRLSRRSTRHYCRQVHLVLDLSWTAGAGDTGTGGVPKTDQASSSNSLGMARGVHSGCIISPSALNSEPPHFTLLYYTLVLDDAIPIGYLREFMSLETPARRAANRLQTSAASVSDSMASMALIALRRESDHRAAVAGTIADQLVIADDMRPKRFRTKWQRAIYDGPTARKDAEAAERDRWIQLLANLLRSTNTPMGKLIRESPSNIQLLGRRSPSRNAQVEGSVCAKVPWLACCFARYHLSCSLAAVDGVSPGQVLRTLRPRIFEACPFLVHLLAGGGWG